MAVSKHSDDDFYNASLSRREVRLLAEWERARRTFVTLDEVRKSVGAAASNVVRGLTRKGALQRVGRGTYLVRPFRSLTRPTATSTAVMAATLLHREPYYLGGRWAVAFHHLSEQRYSNLIDAFVRSRRAPRQLGVGRVRFHAVPARLLGYGITTTELEGLPVRVSDVERTLLDALDHPKLFGPVGSSLALLQEQLPRIDRRRLASYAIAGSKTSTCQRLGLLLERANSPAAALRELRAKARQTKSLLSLVPGERRTGPVDRTWNVVENDG